MLYAIGRRILQPFGKLLFHLKVEGAECFPKNGRIILCCNHRSVFDPILLALACPRQIRYMAKSELFEKHGKAIQKLFYALGAFPVHRNSGDMGSIKTAFALLKEDAVVGIFPQGTCVAQGCLLYTSKRACGLLFAEWSPPWE